MKKNSFLVSHKIRKKIIGDSWYASVMPDICDSLDEILINAPRIVAVVAKKFGMLRGVLLFVFSWNYSIVVLHPSNPGFFPFLFLEYLFAGGRAPRIILLEFIRGEAPNNFLRKLIHPLWLKLFIGPIFRETIKYAHVLSQHEEERYSQLYRMPKKSFIFIPWPMRLYSDAMPGRCLAATTSDMVVASGKAACDWETIFKAAAGSYWPLVVICCRRDFAQVAKLNSDHRATVLCDITREEHRRYVREAGVYVLSLREGYYSAGHVRLSECIREGTVVIATDVTALKGYIIHNETGILVPPGDPSAMRCAIDVILTDRERGRNLSKRAFELAESYTNEIYLEKIKSLLLL